MQALLTVLRANMGALGANNTAAQCAAQALMNISTCADHQVPLAKLI